MTISGSALGDSGQASESDAAVSLIRILIVEDHFVARLGIREFINAQADLKVVAETQSGDEASALYHLHRPDIVLMDVRMPGLDGARATAAIRQSDPQARVLIVSTYDAESEVRRAHAAGALGYITKEAEPTELLTAIRAVHAGKPYITAALAQHIRPEATDRVTPREVRILEMISRGCSNREIADAMDLTPGTMRVYVHQILGKLGVANRAAAVSTAIRMGLIKSV